MRNKIGEYEQKVFQELSIYQQKMLDDSIELTEMQKLTLSRLIDMRSWLLEGHTDVTVLSMTKTVHGLGDRRSRELLIITYELFAELRRSKNTEGIKFIEAEVLDIQASEVLAQAKKIQEDWNKLHVGRPMDAETVKSYTELMKLWKSIKKESATIKGAYEKESRIKPVEKPTQVTFIKVSSKEEAERAKQYVAYEEVRDSE